MRRRWIGRGGARRGSTRWSARLAVVAGAGTILLAIAAPPAGANYGRVTARVGCDRTVVWTASASTEGDDADRTNTRVLVEYRTGDSGDGEWKPAAPENHFDADNDFRFSGSFSLPANADSVDLRVTPLAPWGPDGKGDEPGGPRFSRAEVPAGCAEQPIAANVVEDCDNGGARVTARNVGDERSTVTVSADGVAIRNLEVVPGDTSELIVPVLAGDPTPIRVAAGDFVIAEATVGEACGSGGPAAVVIERCASRQAVVRATLGDRREGDIQIRVAGAIVHKADMEAGRTLQRTLELPASGATPVEVAVAGTTLVSGEVGGCSGPIAGAVTCGVDGAPACGGVADEAPPPPPPPPPPTSIELDGPMLPRTGPWERAIALLLGGALLLAGGVAVATHDRRRPVPSQVSAAIAPYRQRWWD